MKKKPSFVIVTRQKFLNALHRGWAKIQYYSGDFLVNRDQYSIITPAHIKGMEPSECKVKGGCAYGAVGLELMVDPAILADLLDYSMDLDVMGASDTAGNKGAAKRRVTKEILAKWPKDKVFKVRKSPFIAKLKRAA